MDEIVGIYYYYSNYGKRSLKEGQDGMTQYAFEKFVSDTGVITAKLVGASRPALMFIRLSQQEKCDSLNLNQFIWLITDLAWRCFGEKPPSQDLMFLKSDAEYTVSPKEETLKNAVVELFKFMSQSGQLNTFPKRYLRTDSEYLWQSFEAIRMSEPQRALYGKAFSLNWFNANAV